jgi:hypothetical protein
VRLNAFADRPGVLEIPRSKLKIHRALVQQADRLFGSRHYAHYDFLLSLSDQIQQIGTEHHQSSENGQDPEYFTDREATIESRRPACARVHPFLEWEVTSRPADLWTPSYDRARAEQPFVGLRRPDANIAVTFFARPVGALDARRNPWSSWRRSRRFAMSRRVEAGAPLVDTTQDEAMNGRRPQS